MLADGGCQSELVNIDPPIERFSVFSLGCMFVFNENENNKNSELRGKFKTESSNQIANSKAQALLD